MKKRVLILLAIFAAVLLWNPQNVHAADISDCELRFDELSDGYRVASSREDISGDLVIPDSYNGKPIVGIDKNAFTNRTGLTGVTFPETITEIGQFAFADCLNLTDVTFQEGLEIIQNQALSYCASLTTVTLPQSLTRVDYDVYWSSEQLRDIYYNGTQYRYESIAFDFEEDRYPEGVTVHYLSIALPFDFNEDDQITDADAIYLLRHTLFPENYPLNSSGDANGDGQITDADAIYLLRHTLFPESYPLN